MENTIFAIVQGRHYSILTSKFFFSKAGAMAALNEFAKDKRINDTYHQVIVDTETKFMFLSGIDELEICWEIMEVPIKK